MSTVKGLGPRAITFVTYYFSQLYVKVLKVLELSRPSVAEGKP